MASHHPILFPLSAGGLALVALLSAPSAFAVVRQIRKGAPRDNFYEDRDGKSTPEAVAKFSNNIPKIVVLLFSGIGLGTSIAVSVLTAIDARRGLALESWLVTASWGLIHLQTILLATLKHPIQAHDVAFWAFISSAIVGLNVVLQTYATVDDLLQRNDIAVFIRVVNILALLVTLFGSILIPRRPMVYFRDEPVDAQWTSSVLSRYTWSWTRRLIDVATKKGDLEEKDVPQPDHTIRAEEVMIDWHGLGYDGKLLWQLLHAYKGRLGLQWSVTLARCVLGAAPFWTMLHLIDNLQQRGGGGSPGRDLWGLVILLGVLSLAEQWIDGWVNYYSITMISQPMRAQLSALVYEKSLRRKDVKSVDKPKSAEQPAATAAAAAESTDDAPPLITITDAADGPATTNNADTQPGEQPNDESKDEDKNDKPAPSPEGSSVLKSRQAIVNLVGVDSRRISSFAAFQFLIINSLGKLLVYSIFLIQLIGWVPFVAGIIAWALVLPVNTYFSKRYIRLTEELMTVRDEKLSVVNEALLGIRQIKFSALEKQWEERIMDMRDKELSKTWKIFLGDVVLFSCWVVSPIFLAAAALATYVLLNGGLSASVAFTAISIFKSLEVTLGALPEILTTAFDTLVSVRRVDTYLKGPEMKKSLEDGKDITFENAAVAWPVDDEDVSDDDRFILRGLNFTFPAGELSVVSGKTGTGKSLILSALIGEADVLEGKIFVPPAPSAFDRHDAGAHLGNWILPGSIAYVAQSPWLEGASLRDNILFGLPLVESRYEEVLQACALKKDLEILTDGDKTELGANGINLSGGQKWRVTLARTIYSRAEILILDDIFSAVDAHVGRHIFDKCIAGDICKGRTRILVTHHVALVEPKTKFLVELGDGSVSYAGLTSELEENGALELIKSHEQDAIKGLQREETGESSTVVDSETTSAAGIPSTDDAEATQDGNIDGGAPETAKPKDSQANQKPKKFTQDEAREKGMVKTRVYASYMQDCGGWPFWIMCALSFMGFEASNLLRAWWVRIWTGGDGAQAGSIGAFQDHRFGYTFMPQQSVLPEVYGHVVTAGDQDSLQFYLWIYVGISIAMAAVGTFRFYWSFLMSLKGSKVLFRRILNTVLRTPLRWLDTVPVGRILNRLTSDFEVIDQRLTMDLGMLFWHALSLVGVCVAAALVSPYILPAAVVLITAAAFVGKKYLDGARPLKRLESVAKSPVFELFNSTLSGISTLRAFRKTGVYTDRMYKSLDFWGSVSVYMWNVNRWLGFRMALIGAIFTTTIGIVVIVSPQVDAAMAGFTISFALDFSINMLLAIRNYSQLELDMNAAERVMEYSELKTEAQGGQEPPAAWPTSGRIEVDKLEVAYAEDLPPVLKGISFQVGDNERVGVIGRTGAGKSSLTLALFRFIEARSGSVFIDGLDISKIDLHSLRSRLAIIPQDPVLFSGTIRSNLDPFGERTDMELRASLARVHLIDSTAPTPANEPASGAASIMTGSNMNIFRDLSSPVSESGGNLSQGQRQLLCLARAIVSRPKIMVLDEATSAVDMDTDALIQRSIREEFTSSTLIVIAHRLSTIIDFDRILVLDQGKAAEFGSPRELWEKEGSIFRDLCESSGERDKLEEAVFGHGSR